MLCSFFRICFPSAIFFQFVVFVVISAMSFVCLLYFSWICFFLPFSFLFCCRSILSTHLMFISSTSSRSNWLLWKSANRTKIRIFTRKWTRIPKTPSTIDQIVYLSRKNANECNFHFIYCNRANEFSLFVSVSHLLSFSRYISILSSFSTANLYSPYFEMELILLFRTRTICYGVTAASSFSY